MSRLALAALVVVTTSCSTGGIPAEPTPVSTAAANPALRDELLAMLAADQAERLDEAAAIDGDRSRTQRLRQIIAEHGWPTRTLVGDDGATAAWAIAQHSDLDQQFQQQALELMRQAVAAGEADPGELAYLVDRVAANAGQPQTYGTQMGCTESGEPQLAPLAEPDRVDELRGEAGLPPLEEYLAELAEVCAQS